MNDDCKVKFTLVFCYLNPFVECFDVPDKKLSAFFILSHGCVVFNLFLSYSFVTRVTILHLREAYGLKHTGITEVLE